MGVQSNGVLQGGGVGEMVGGRRGKVSLRKGFDALSFSRRDKDLHSELGFLDMAFLAALQRNKYDILIGPKSA
jgi:hypothetical protein